MKSPAPKAIRCTAVVYRGNYGFAGRCPYQRDKRATEAAVADLCAKHGARQLAGLAVKRVTAEAA